MRSPRTYRIKQVAALSGLSTRALHHYDEIGLLVPSARTLRRTKSYAEKDWARLRDEQGAIYTEAYAALKAGKRPDDPEVMEVAERHRLSIDRWFYPCGAAMHSGLADLYEADARFAANIDKHGGPGLTTFLVAAIRANAARSARGGAQD